MALLCSSRPLVLSALPHSPSLPFPSLKSQYFGKRFQTTQVSPEYKSCDSFTGSFDRRELGLFHHSPINDVSFLLPWTRKKGDSKVTRIELISTFSTVVLLPLEVSVKGKFSQWPQQWLMQDRCLSYDWGEGRFLFSDLCSYKRTSSEEAGLYSRKVFPIFSIIFGYLSPPWWRQLGSTSIYGPLLSPKAKELVFFKTSAKDLQTRSAKGQPGSPLTQTHKCPLVCLCHVSQPDKGVGPHPEKLFHELWSCWWEVSPVLSTSFHFLLQQILLRSKVPPSLPYDVFPQHNTPLFSLMFLCQLCSQHLSQPLARAFPDIIYLLV